MKLHLFIFFIFISQIFHAQTGPGGVDNSTNNVLWLKADAGTSTTTNGSAVSSWTDQSGNGNTVSQATANQQPLYQTNIINGMPTLLFDNVSNTNDYFTGADASNLDNTTGFSIFTVTRPLNLDNASARAIISKRTNVDIDESYMFFYYTSNKIFSDVETTNDRFTTVTTFSNSTNYIASLIYDGTLISANRSKVYVGENLDGTHSETSSSIPDNASPLIIGATNVSDGRPFGGHMAEIIVFRKTLNDAERIIVNNYLSAKYNISLTANDMYAGDNSVLGDYDSGVAGIGQSAAASTNTSYSTSVAGGMGLSYVSGFDNGDYIMSGYNLSYNYEFTVDIGGITGTNPARWIRDWYIDVTNTGTNITTNITFDFNNAGVGSAPSGTTTNYVLLYRAGLSGNWTELTNASSISGTQVIFNSVTLTNDGYYTLGTHDRTNSSLPIELLEFSAIANGEKVDLKWSTATETNNAFFTIEKSKDAQNFTKVVDMPGAGNSITVKDYFETDYQPYTGISYYRLKQTDKNGNYKYFQLVPVSFNPDKNVSIFPNPSNAGQSVNVKITGYQNEEVIVVLRDIAGKEYFSKVLLTEENNQIFAVDEFQNIPAGIYLVVASSDNKIYSQKIIIK